MPEPITLFNLQLDEQIARALAEAPDSPQSEVFPVGEGFHVPNANSNLTSTVNSNLRPEETNRLPANNINTINIFNTTNNNSIKLDLATERRRDASRYISKADQSTSIRDSITAPSVSGIHLNMASSSRSNNNQSSENRHSNRDQSSANRQSNINSNLDLNLSETPSSSNVAENSLFTSYLQTIIDGESRNNLSSSQERGGNTEVCRLPSELPVRFTICMGDFTRSKVTISYSLFHCYFQD